MKRISNWLTGKFFPIFRRRPEICPTCRGRGAIRTMDDGCVECQTCKGEGEIGYRPMGEGIG